MELLQDGNGDDPRRSAMARPYSDDLRWKFLSAYDAGTYSLGELAAIFMVSEGWAKKISAARTRTGRAERPPYQPGRKPHANAQVQQQVVAWVAAQPDLTLVEIQQKLKAEAAVVLSRGRVGALVNKLGLRLKKSRSTPPNAIPKPTKNGTQSLSKKSAT
jgi:transposase